MLALPPWRPVQRVVYISRWCRDEDDVGLLGSMQSAGGMPNINEQNRSRDLRLVNVQILTPHGSCDDENFFSFKETKMITSSISQPQRDGRGEHKAEAKSSIQGFRGLYLGHVLPVCVAGICIGHWPFCRLRHSDWMIGSALHRRHKTQAMCQHGS